MGNCKSVSPPETPKSTQVQVHPRRQVPVEGQTQVLQQQQAESAEPIEVQFLLNSGSRLLEVVNANAEVGRTKVVLAHKVLAIPTKVPRDVSDRISEIALGHLPMLFSGFELANGVCWRDTGICDGAVLNADEANLQSAFAEMCNQDPSLQRCQTDQSRIAAVLPGLYRITANKVHASETASLGGSYMYAKSRDDIVDIVEVDFSHANHRVRGRMGTGGWISLIRTGPEGRPQEWAVRHWPRGTTFVRPLDT